MIEDMVARVKMIPPLPESFYEVDDVYRSENGNVNSMAKAVAKDPMFVANLLKSANSPLYGFSREIKSVLQAVSLFGMTTTRNLCLNISAKQLLNIDIEPYGISAEKFGDIMNLQGALAFTWYMKIDPMKKDFLFLCGLMQEIGKVIIADEVVQNNETTQFKSEISTTLNVDQVENSYTGAMTAHVTASVFKHWNLDEVMVDILEKSVDPFCTDDIQSQEAMALFIIRKAIPVNAPLTERSISIAKSFAQNGGFDVDIFEQAANEVKTK